MSSVSGMPTIQIEESLHDALKETDLLSFQHKLAIEKQLTKIEHFDHVTDDELKGYGLSAPAVRRLRTALDKRKKNKKSKLFSSAKPKPTKFINADCESPTSNQTSSSMPSTSQAAGQSVPCLISRDDVKLMEKLGDGNFATVKRGIWQRSGSSAKIDCAVKILHQMSEQAVEDLQAEIGHMQKMKHQNVIQLFGIVFGEPTMLVIEYCDGGSLLDRLRNTKKPVLLVTKLLGYALQIASGMAYLENRHVIHRDLALRNILLAENEEVVKICDFGMTRSLEDNERLYVMSGQKKVPFGWCPPESLRFRQFSQKSDCWAFGVSLWELYTYGEEPWVGQRAADVLRITEQGEQLIKPRKCLQEIYEIMQMCWNLTPDLRPKFSHLRNLLLDIKFMTAETRESYISDEPDALELSVGDHVIIISENAQKEWYGQCVSSRKFGKFPHSLVSVKSHRVTNMTNPASNVGISSPNALAAMSSTINTAYQSSNRNDRISKPIIGSLIHTGHGDIDKDKCWGNVDRIDEIYLKNPVIRPPPVGAESRSHGVSFISSITALHDDFLASPNTNAKVRPVSENPIKLDFDPLKAWNSPTPPTIEPRIQKIAPAKPPPPVFNKPKIANESAPNLTAFDSLKSEYEKMKLNQNRVTSTGVSTFNSNYTTSTEIPWPTQSNSFNQSASLGYTSTPSNPAISPRRNQTQPIILPSAPTKPISSVFEPQTPENDPFVVDPNLKNLSMKPQPIQFQDSIPWRPPPIASMDQFPRPQSARLNSSFEFAPKPTPLDQNLLALLDPLLSSNAKSTTLPSTSQIVPPKPIKTHIKPIQSIQEPKIRPVPTSSVPRPQSATHFATAPSALNVLAFVAPTNQQRNGQSKANIQQQIPSTTTSNPVQNKQPSSAWTYLPSTNTLQTALANKNGQTTLANTSNGQMAQNVALSNTNGQSIDKPIQPTSISQSISKPIQPSQITINKPIQPVNNPTQQQNQSTTRSSSILSTSSSPYSSLLPPPSELAQSTNPTPSTTNSFLPPPSQLLLSGLKKEETTASKTSDSAYGSLTSNSSSSRLVLNTNLMNDPFSVIPRMENSQQTQQVFNIQHSPISAYNLPSSNNLFFQTTQQQYNPQPNMIITQNNQPMFYSQSGIPFLLPTPLQPTAPTTSAAKPNTTISLNDLDIDKMVDNVKRKVDFATVDQCSKALRASGYEIEEAIQRLKVEKLIEMGVCSDQNTAFRALTSTDWNVNDAAIKLVS